MIRALLMAFLLTRLRRQHPELFDSRLAAENVDGALRDYGYGPAR